MEMDNIECVSLSEIEEDDIATIATTASAFHQRQKSFSKQLAGAAAAAASGVTPATSSHGFMGIGFGDRIVEMCLTPISIPNLNNISNQPSLQQLSLRSNPALVGPIPPQLSSLLSLRVLTLSQNRLSDKIPPTISLLASLLHLDLSYNSLAGRISTQIGQMHSLVDLDLSYNSLSGQIPSSIGQMYSLQILDRSSNSLAA